MKKIVARNTSLAYLYFNENFKIHTNASDFQLGEIIIQKGKLTAFYIRKLADSQKRYI